MRKILFPFLILLLGFLSTQSQAQSNQYLHFDGVNDYTSLPNAAAPLDGSNTITMAGWFYTDALVYGQGMMSIRGGGTGSGEMYVIQLSNGKLECRVVTTTGLKEYASPDNTIVAGTWQHIAWVFDATTVKLYVDGVMIGSSAASGIFQSADKPFTVGRCIISTLDFYFGGRADEVTLWSKALTEAEINDLKDNGLATAPTGLVTYYKFNQGVPGGNNTSITQLISEFDATKNAQLFNFALDGATSNFNGELEDGFQAISFPSVPNKLISAAPFTLSAIATSGLPVSYEIVSGPAIVSGSTVTLDGTAGSVTIKAMQAGDETFSAAADQTITFEVLDPNAVLVNTAVSHPLSGNVYSPSLQPILVSINAAIDYPELFSIATVTAKVDGTTLTLTNHGSGYYTGWWTPPAYGSHEITVTSTNNFGAINTETNTFNLMTGASNVVVNGTDEAWVNINVATVIQEADLPSHIGAYDKIIGKLIIDCPSGGCDPWDRISHVEVKGKDGKWYEIIRYLTPYGVACQSEIDLTDFASLLLGKTEFRVTLGTQGNGFLYTLRLEYRAGTPVNAYSNVQKLWYDTYQFGDMANLQPAEEFGKPIASTILSAKIKLVATGHGWGNNNTGNAAEFQRNKHHIWVNGVSTFEQDNWNICNPNPDGCSPQAGTWYHNRAGWCPGSIAQFFNFDLTPHIGGGWVNLKYIFDESYKDYCHPNNPDCVTGTTCPDCNDGFNPHLVTSSYLITYSNAPQALNIPTEVASKLNLHLFPNPSSGMFTMEWGLNTIEGNIVIYDITGKSIQVLSVKKGMQSIAIDMTGVAAGAYVVTLNQDGQASQSSKIIIE